VRREVYLIFKEAVNNVARHSGCTHAEVVISIDKSHLDLRIEDNGKGLCERRNQTGNGLSNMSERARRIGGRIEFSGGKQGGVRVVFQVPLRYR
jgi:signal transduction histidine kinase